MGTCLRLHAAVVGLVLLACFLPKVVNTRSKWRGPPPVGDEKPLGSHMRPMGATTIGKFSSPHVFYGHFVKASKPIHMKSALSDANHPGMEWTDAYFREKFGTEMVRVELGKKETRNRKAEWLRFSEFLDCYSFRDLYMVHSLSGPLTELVFVPHTLECGGFERALQEAVLWMGQGPLKSVLHYDELDNLLCVFDGTKDVVLIDQFYKEKVEADGFDQEGHFSHVDPESVDMKAFPQFQDLPWYRVHLSAGDCLYIPYKWYHQVSSYGTRSLAINIWFSHLWWFDDDSCAGIQSSSSVQPLNKIGFASPNEATRSKWLETFEGTDDDVDLPEFKKLVPFGTDERKKQLYLLIDLDNDGYVSWEELYGFNIDQALPLFPDVFGVNSDSMAEADYRSYQESTSETHTSSKSVHTDSDTDSGQTVDSAKQHKQEAESADADDKPVDSSQHHRQGDVDISLSEEEVGPSGKTPDVKSEVNSAQEENHLHTQHEEL